MPVTENYDDRQDIQGLPAGLPDSIYATWLSALREIKDSPSNALGKERYQFCCGYVQALQDSSALDDCLCRLLNSQLQDL